MHDRQLPEVMIAIASNVPKKMTLKELSLKIGCTINRLEAIKSGACITSIEAEAFAREFGGTPLDYRPFFVQEDPWWQQQPANLQAKIQQLIEQANYSYQKSISNINAYNKQLAIFVVATLVIIIIAIGHGVWLEYKYQKLRPEANRYVARIYTHRQIAWAEAGIEVVNAEIDKVKHYVDLINQSKLSSANRAKAQRSLLNLVRYYRSTIISYQQVKKLAQLTLDSPKYWGNNNILLDPITYQNIDVEDINGGQLNQEKIKELIRLQLNVQADHDIVNDIINSKKPADSIPDIANQYETSTTNNQLCVTN